MAPFVSLFTKLRTLHPGSLDDSPVGRDLTQSLPSAEASAPCLPEVPGVSLHEGRRWRVPRGHVDASTLWWLGPHPSPPFSHTPRRSLGKSCKHEKIPHGRTRSCYSNSPLIVLMRPPPPSQRDEPAPWAVCCLLDQQHSFDMRTCTLITCHVSLRRQAAAATRHKLR